jgi:hypothetical protein
MADDLIGLKVRLDRDTDRAKPCHNNLAVIGPGKGKHVAAVRCADCGAHRGWLAEKTCNLILATVRRLGAPLQPIVVRQTEKEVGMPDYDNRSRGVLFKNTDKDPRDERERDDSGSFTDENGVEYWLSGWRRKSKKGTPYISLSIKPKQEKRSEKTLADDMADTVPF